jgi:hypothetical protein
MRPKAEALGYLEAEATATANANATATATAKAKARQKQMRGFFAALRMTSVCGWLRRTDNGKGNRNRKNNGNSKNKSRFLRYAAE